MGYLLLAGGGEFEGSMSEPDRRAMELSGGTGVPIGIIPAAAAPDKNHHRAGQNGVRWFQGLGAIDVKAIPITDRASADNPGAADQLLACRLIYLLGGFPRHLGETLAGSLCGQAVAAAYRSASVVAGSSAGAMVLCENYYDPKSGTILRGLSLVENACVLPHHDTFGKGWATRLQELLPASVLLGIDEQTGMVNDGPDGGWQVYGKGTVTLYRSGRKARFGPGRPFHLVR